MAGIQIKDSFHLLRSFAKPLDPGLKIAGMTNLKKHVVPVCLMVGTQKMFLQPLTGDTGAGIDAGSRTEDFRSLIDLRKTAAMLGVETVPVLSETFRLLPSVEAMIDFAKGPAASTPKSPGRASSSVPCSKIATPNSAASPSR
jgi:hypothetical protein